jgi:hypothetical protein
MSKREVTSWVMTGAALFSLSGSTFVAACDGRATDPTKGNAWLSGASSAHDSNNQQSDAAADGGESDSSTSADGSTEDASSPDASPDADDSDSSTNADASTDSATDDASTDSSTDDASTDSSTDDASTPDASDGGQCNGAAACPAYPGISNGNCTCTSEDGGASCCSDGQICGQNGCTTPVCYTEPLSLPSPGETDPTGSTEQPVDQSLRFWTDCRNDGSGNDGFQGCEALRCFDSPTGNEFTCPDEITAACPAGEDGWTDQTNVDPAPQVRLPLRHTRGYVPSPSVPATCPDTDAATLIAAHPIMATCDNTLYDCTSAPAAGGNAQMVLTVQQCLDACPYRRARVNPSTCI